MTTDFPVHGDCGSWVLNAEDGTWYGHIVAGKPETTVAYIVLARDIFRDIRDQFGGRQIRMPIEADFVNETVAAIERQLTLPTNESQSLTVTPKSSLSINLRTSEKSGWRPPTLRRPFKLPRINKRHELDLECGPRIEAYHSHGDLTKAEAQPDVPFEHGSRWFESCIQTRHAQGQLLKLKQNLRMQGGLQNGNEYQFLHALDCAIINSPEISLENLTEQLRDHFIEDLDDITRSQLIFNSIGWLTMAMPSLEQEANDKNTRRKDVSINYQDFLDHYTRPISFLLGKFDLLSAIITPPLYRASNRPPPPLNDWLIQPTLCFSAIHGVADVAIEWTEQLATHLEFDQKRRVLKLFAYPSVSNTIMTVAKNP